MASRPRPRTRKVDDMTTTGPPTTLRPDEADGLLISVILTDEGRQDPVSVYRRLLAESPHWKSSFGMTVLARYDDGLEYLRNPRWGRSEPDMDIPEPLSGASRR